MDLSTRYLGLRLDCPIVAGASPLADHVDTARRLEDAGVGAIVMRSLFEEQIEMEVEATLGAFADFADLSAEAQSFFPRPSEFAMGPENYVEHIRRLKAAVNVPVIASLNGTSAAGWLSYARRIAEAGADALELNIYYVASNPEETGAAVEARTLEVVRRVKSEIQIPIAVKLSPFFSSLSHFVAEVEAAGADGVVLFNRFYHPDIDPEALEVVPRLQLSTPAELPLRLRWLAILSAQARLSFASSGGVHDGRDAVRAIMAGAHAVQVVSTLLQNGPEHVSVLRGDLARWMETHEYDAVDQMRASMNLARCPDPGIFERANYMRILTSWRQR